MAHGPERARRSHLIAGSARTRVASAIVVLAVAFSAKPRAWAAEPGPSARAQYDAAARAFGAKRYVEAALLFEGAAELQPHGATLFMAGRAWELSDHPERAADAYGRALREGGLAEKQGTYAQSRLAVLESTLGAVDVTSTEPVRVQVDKQSEVRPPVRLHATPGVHTLVVRGDGWLSERKVTFEAGAPKEVAITAKDREEALSPPPPASKPEPPPPPKPVVAAPPPPPAKAPSSGLRTVGWISGGVGLALLGTAGVLWYEANQLHTQYVNDPTEETRSRGLTFVTLSTVGFVAGGVLTAAGAALVLWPSPSGAHAALAPTLGGATLSGVF